jgi:integrase
VWRVLFHRGGKLLDDQGWNERVWHPAVRAAGMTGSRSGGMHGLRHWYVSTLIAGGADPKQIQEYCGHSTITTTLNLYGHLFQRSHDRARNIIDAAFAANVAHPSPMASVAGAYPVRTQHDR